MRKTLTWRNTLRQLPRRYKLCILLYRDGQRFGLGGGRLKHTGQGGEDGGGLGYGYAERREQFGIGTIFLKMATRFLVFFLDRPRFTEAGWVLRGRFSFHLVNTAHLDQSLESFSLF